MIDQNRSQLRKLQRTVNDTSAAIKRIRAEEDSVEREASQIGVLTTQIVFGTSSDRPDSTYLKTKGTQSLLFYATNTGVLSAWDGANWKSTTLV